MLLLLPIISLEAEYDIKLAELKKRHAEELEKQQGGDSEGQQGCDDSAKNLTTSSDTAGNEKNDVETEAEKALENDERQRRSKQEKARRKREKAREKERQREQQIAEENANAVSPRDTENEIILEKLRPLQLTIKEVPADGNCLYSAVGACCNDGVGYTEMRSLAADTLLEKEEQFAAFCEYSDDVPDFQGYCQNVRNSSDWGGHLELRALACALNRPVLVYSASTDKPLVIQPRDGENVDAESEMDDPATDPIRVSYHLHYYALGEHYNQVVSIED